MSTSAISTLQPQHFSVARYDAMCQAIAECHQVDEVKNIRDKAAALEHYYKQARNTDAEWKVAEIRVRAERRVGQLLKEMERAGHDRGNQYVAKDHDGPQPKSDYAQALADNRIPATSAKRYQALAAVPDVEFEAAMTGGFKPTTSALLKIAKSDPLDEMERENYFEQDLMGLTPDKITQPEKPVEPVKPMDRRALWIWGRMLEMEREGYFEQDPRVLLSEMTPEMRSGVCRVINQVVQFFSHLKEHCDESI